MEIKIPRELNIEIENASKVLGFDEKEIIERAILFYLDVIKKQLDLNKEFNEWDILSDESLVNFENSL